MGIYEKLSKVQEELKAPKGQYNSFGKYKYRSCEDILEAVKPILIKNKLSLQLYDELLYIGDRYYIRATARLLDLEDNSTMENTAYAREDEIKKGMDGSQITGTASSYARKYALNGLLCIDDTKDTDSEEYQSRTSAKTSAKKELMIQDSQKELIINKFEKEEIKKYLEEINKSKLSDLTLVEASNLLKRKEEK